jgi:hypothetical protein
MTEWGRSTDLAGLHDRFPVASETLRQRRADRVTRRLLWLVIGGAAVAAYVGAL